MSVVGCGFLAVLVVAVGQRPIRKTENTTSADIQRQDLGQRTELPDEAVSAEGLIRLDATVTDESGNPVAGLQRADFRLFDNGQPQKIIAFRASKSPAATPDDSLAVI
ncbi:MAG: hypothetical protein WBQ79_12680, partial [Acidobacteriaceae bacterium]